MREFTKEDVLAYELGLMTDPAELEAFEAALETDAQLRERLDLLSTDEDAEIRATFDSVAAKLADRIAIDLWLEEIGNDPLVPSPPSVLKPQQLHDTVGGLVLQTEVLQAASNPEEVSIPPVRWPLIEVDYRSGLLTVRQRLAALARGLIDVIVVRLREGAAPAVYRLKDRQLERARDYWYDDIPLTQVLPDGWTIGDKFVYIVRAAGDTPGPTTSGGE